MEYKILEELSIYGLLKDFLKSKVLENKIGKKYKVIGAVTQVGILGINPDNWNDKFIK